VSQTSQSLQQDYSQVAAALLTELVNIRRAEASGANISSVPSSPLSYVTPFKPVSNDLWVNGLWFLSFALSLSTALIPGIIKQWLQHYTADVTGSRRSPRDRACIRQFRFMGLSRWGVRPIVELLPVLMNLSPLLFFTGMVIYLWVLSGAIAWAMAALTSISYTLYLGTSSLPLLRPQCPYKSSLTWVLHFASTFTGRLRLRLVNNLRHL
jgi:hypothetical protein